MKGHKKRGIGLRYALNGIKEAFVHERNIRIHLIATILVVSAGVFFSLTAVEWLFVLFAIQLVIITELINSTIERMIDYFKPELHPKAKVIKDMAAGSVLIAALFSVIIGMIIFLPKLLNM